MPVLKPSCLSEERNAYVSICSPSLRPPSPLLKPQPSASTFHCLFFPTHPPLSASFPGKFCIPVMPLSVGVLENTGWPTHPSPAIQLTMHAKGGGTCCPLHSSGMGPPPSYQMFLVLYLAIEILPKNCVGCCLLDMTKLSN